RWFFAAISRPRRGLARRANAPRRRGRAAVAWAVVAFLGLQVALNVCMEVRHPEVYDPEYRDRLFLLREHARDLSDLRPLLVVGSSRVMTNFRPEELPAMQTADGRWVLPFNLAHSGSGPLLNLILVQRALRDGISPGWVVVEVMPAFLGDAP